MLNRGLRQLLASTKSLSAKDTLEDLLHVARSTEIEAILRAIAADPNEPPHARRMAENVTGAWDDDDHEARSKRAEDDTKEVPL